MVVLALKRPVLAREMIRPPKLSSHYLFLLQFDTWRKVFVKVLFSFVSVADQPLQRPLLIDHPFSPTLLITNAGKNKLAINVQNWPNTSYLAF